MHAHPRKHIQNRGSDGLKHRMGSVRMGPPKLWGRQRAGAHDFCYAGKLLGRELRSEAKMPACQGSEVLSLTNK